MASSHRPLHERISTSTETPSTSLPNDHHNHCINGDTICPFHKSAILLTAGIEHDTDLIYMQLQSSFSDNPYCILLDHEYKSVVVSIRGTFSLEDCVTDVLIEPELIEQLGIDYHFDATNQYCHSGVISCVRNVHRDLENHKWLDRLLYDDNAPYRNYTLQFVGHSLGAATATILSYMYRHKYPTLKCWNYSPPGCTITWEMAIQCHDWCIAFVLDSDLVPRISVQSLERLRDEILELIGQIKVPKIQITKRLLDTALSVQQRTCYGTSCYCCCGSACCYPTNENDEDSNHHHHGPNDDDDTKQQKKEREMNELLSDILYEPHEIPDSSYKRQLERFRTIQNERKRSRGTIRSIQLYPPGKIVHVVKTGAHNTCTIGCLKCVTCCTTNIGSKYVPIWINNDDLNEIVVSTTMGFDHFPNHMSSILEQVTKEYMVVAPTLGSSSSIITTTTNNNQAISAHTADNHNSASSHINHGSIL